jgi:DNA-directed RNA polymerase specialized sigma24 family protein
MPPENKNPDQIFTQPFPHFLESLTTDLEKASAEFSELARSWLLAHPTSSMQILSDSDRREVVNGTIERCLQKDAEPLRNYSDQGAPFGDWLARVAEDTCTKWIRGQQKPASAGTMAPAAPITGTASDKPDDRLLAQIVWEYIRGLDDRYRSIALLGFGDGWKQSEMVWLLGLRGRPDATKTVSAKLRNGRRELSEKLISLDFHREDDPVKKKPSAEADDDLDWLDEWLYRAARHVPDIEGFERPSDDAIDAYLLDLGSDAIRAEVQNALMMFRDFRQEVMERIRMLAETPAAEASAREELAKLGRPPEAKPQSESPPVAGSTSASGPRTKRPSESKPTPARTRRPAARTSKTIEGAVASPKPHREAPGRRGVMAFFEWLRTPRVLAPIAALAVLAAILSMQSRFRGGGIGSGRGVSYPDNAIATIVPQTDVKSSIYDVLHLPIQPPAAGGGDPAPSTVVFRSARIIVFEVAVGDPEATALLSSVDIKNERGESVWQDIIPVESIKAGHLYLQIEPNSFRPGDYVIDVLNVEGAVVTQPTFKISQ